MSLHCLFEAYLSRFGGLCHPSVTSGDVGGVRYLGTHQSRSEGHAKDASLRPQPLFNSLKSTLTTFHRATRAPSESSLVKPLFIIFLPHAGLQPELTALSYLAATSLHHRSLVHHKSLVPLLHAGALLNVVAGIPSPVTAKSTCVLVSDARSAVYRGKYGTCRNRTALQ